MKLSVTKGFIDKNTNIFHNVGEIVEYPEARAKEIEYKGYGKCLTEKPKPTKVETKKEEPKKEESKKEEPKFEQPKKVSRKK